MAEETIEPRGEGRADDRAAMIASTLANCHRDAKRKREPFKIADFLLKYGEQATALDMSEEQMVTMARMLTLAMGGKVVERGDNREPSGKAATSGG